MWFFLWQFPQSMKTTSVSCYSFCDNHLFFIYSLWQSPLCHDNHLFVRYDSFSDNHLFVVWFFLWHSPLCYEIPFVTITSLSCDSFCDNYIFVMFSSVSFILNNSKTTLQLLYIHSIHSSNIRLGIVNRKLRRTYRSRVKQPPK